MACNNSMGLGELASNRNLVFKRKYRWKFSLEWGPRPIPAQYVKVASRPNLSIEETEINYLHGKMFLPGKGTWETTTVTYYDVGNASDNGITELYSWLSSIYDFTNSECFYQSSRLGNNGGRNGYAGTGRLSLFDGCGTAMETWTLHNVWPQAINFGDLDYASSDEVTIELTLRYSHASLVLGCGTNFSAPSCYGCNSGIGNFPSSPAGLPGV